MLTSPKRRTDDSSRKNKSQMTQKITHMMNFPDEITDWFGTTKICANNSGQRSSGVISN